MAIIGTFTKSDSTFNGQIQTLGLKAKVAIVPADKASEAAPDYRVFAGPVEIGAGWTKVSKSGKSYIGLKLDDPSFPAPLYANLVEADKGYELIWSR